MSSQKHRRQKFADSVLHDKNINDLFDKLFNESKLASNERDEFREFMEYIVEMNKSKNLDLRTVNKYVTTKFDLLWKNYEKQKNSAKKEGYENPVDKRKNNNKSTNKKNNNNDVEYFDTATVVSAPISRRRGRGRQEQFLPPNEDRETHNFMTDHPDYQYSSAGPPGKVDPARRRVPYNYNNQLPRQSEVELEFGGQIFNQKSQYARAMNADRGITGVDSSMMGGINDINDALLNDSQDIYIGPPLEGPGTSLATDSSGNPYDQNVAFASTVGQRTEQVYIITIDSRLRDIVLSPSSSSYKISLTELLGKEFGYIREMNGLTNVVDIQLSRISIPNIIRDSTTQFYEPYLFVDIREIRGNVYTGISDPSRVFSQISYPNSDTLRDIPHMTLYPADAGKTYPKNNTLASLRNLTLDFYNFDGELFDFGEDAPKIAQVTPGNPTIFRTENIHNIVTGDQVYIRGFTSGDDAYDSEINRTKGYVVSVNSQDTFQINYDSTGMTANPPALGNALIAKLQNNLTLRITTFSTNMDN